MKTKKLVALFLCNFAILFIGFGLFPLLPVHAAELGATPGQIGVYLAVTYIAITLGNLLTGWLSGRLSRKVVFVVAGLAGVPALFLLGRVSALWQVVLLTSVVWFTGGIGLALVSVFIGLQASEESRGRWFSLIALTTPLGAVIGGSVVAWMVTWKGYPAMFATLSLVYAVWPLVGWIMVQDQPEARAAQPGTTRSTRFQTGKNYPILLLAVLLSAMTVSVVRMGLSLAMKAVHFSPAAIAGANVVAGLVTIPIVLGFGALSDRLGRRLFLILGFLLASLSGILLVSAGKLWQFWVVASAVLVARSISGSLASALAADFLPPQSLGRGLPWLGTMNWVSGVIGFALSGFLIEILGSNNLYLISALLSLAAAGLIGLLSGQRKKVPALARSAQQVPGQTGSPSTPSWAIGCESAEKSS
jgi:MFS family permease